MAKWERTNRNRRPERFSDGILLPRCGGGRSQRMDEGECVWWFIAKPNKSNGHNNRKITIASDNRNEWKIFAQLEAERSSSGISKRRRNTSRRTARKHLHSLFSFSFRLCISTGRRSNLEFHVSPQQNKVVEVLVKSRGRRNAQVREKKLIINGFF